MNDESNEYQMKSNEIKQLASLPIDKFMGHLTSLHNTLGSAAPNIAPHIYATANNALHFLNSKLPQEPSGSFHKTPNLPSQMQQRAWVDLYKVVNDPVSVLDKIANGTLTDNHIQAVQSIYPALHQEMSKQIMEQLGQDKSKSLSYGKRISISKFLGTPIDSTISLPSFQAIMNTAGPQMPQAPGKSSKENKKATAAELKAADQVTDLYKTSLQAQEERKLK